jgi:transcriptional regulator GlxA family with amidase domain
MEVAQIFMTQLADVANLYQGVPRGRLIRRVIAKMRDNVEHPLPITKLAKDLGCSHRKLANQVRQELGLTSQALYRRIRLSHVRKLLDETDLPIGEIAIRAGYENASALSRAFRMEFGVTPSGLRARSYYAAG